MKKKSTIYVLLALFLISCSQVLSPTNEDNFTQLSELNSGSAPSRGINMTHGDFVRLYFAKAWNTSNPGEPRSVRGYVEIENVSYEKEVFIRYTEKNSGIWKDVKAEFLKATGENKEIWHFNLSGKELEFAVAYRVMGQEYWDNNGGWNYGINTGGWSGLSHPEYAFGRSVLALDFAQIWSDGNGNYTLGGFVYAKEINSEYPVEIVYTTDHWQTTRTAPCPVTTLIHNQEQVYKIDIPLESLPEHLEFALVYHGPGYQAWDNNFQQNYSLKGIDFIQ